MKKPVILLLAFVAGVGCNSNQPISVNGVEIISPEDGERVRPGQAFEVQVAREPGLELDRIIVGTSYGEFTKFDLKDKGLYTHRFTIPEYYIGRIEILAMGYRHGADHVEDTVSVIIDMTGIECTALDLEFHPPVCIVGSPYGASTFVSADFSDGITRTLKKRGLPLRFSTSDPTIATVNEEGRVIGHKPGEVEIAVSWGHMDGKRTLEVLPE